MTEEVYIGVWYGHFPSDSETRSLLGKADEQRGVFFLKWV